MAQIGIGRLGGKEMKLTDKELSELKDYVGILDTSGPTFIALLRRLECAEIICRAFAHDCPDNDFVKAWRKSAGKE